MKNLHDLLQPFRLRRYGSTARRAARQILKGLRYFDVDLVFDVGANTGQFAKLIRASGYDGSIVSFEPLSDAYQELVQASAGDDTWSVHSRCALGDFDGELEINVAGNSESSSPLQMTSLHSSAAPGSAIVGQEVAPAFKLDSIASSYLAGANRPFLKIDTQGYEWQVLAGASQTLPQLTGVLCEMSLVTLYEGQKLWREIIDFLEAAGFTLWGLQPGFMDGRDGRTLQVDGIFFRV